MLIPYLGSKGIFESLENKQIVISLSILNLVSSFIIFASVIIPIYYSFRLSKTYKKLSVILTAFIITHGIYHLLEYLDYEFMADSIFSPLSQIILIIFGLFLLFIGLRKRSKLRISK